MTDPVIYPENRLRAMAVGERPQERLEKYGAGALSDTELLAMLLRSGTRGLDVVTLSSQLINDAGSLSGLLNWTDADYRKFKGIGKIKTLQLRAIMEIAKRVLGQKHDQEHGESPLLDSAAKVRHCLAPVAHGLEVEKFWVLCLNRKNRLLKRVEVTSGTATAALAHPREVFRDAIRMSAAAVVCAHNHPSGDPSPSAADIQITRQLREAARTIDIELLDHIILGQPALDPRGTGYYSFREAGLL